MAPIDNRWHNAITRQTRSTSQHATLLFDAVEVRWTDNTVVLFDKGKNRQPTGPPWREGSSSNVRRFSDRSKEGYTRAKDPSQGHYPPKIRIALPRSAFFLTDGCPGYGLGRGRKPGHPPSRPHPGGDSTGPRATVKSKRERATHHADIRSRPAYGLERMPHDMISRVCETERAIITGRVDPAAPRDWPSSGRDAFAAVP